MSQIRGRFGKDADRSAADYSASVSYDRRLYPYDIAGSTAHAKMLARKGIISAKDAEEIAAGLAAIKTEIDMGVFQFRPELEDVHMNIEAALIERIGEAGRRLHTARSRNDQVALDTRLFMKDALADTMHGITQLQSSLVALADKYRDVAIPGYTHLQRAQPVLVAHHLLAYFEMLERDKGRFADCLKRTDVLPLGSGALAGVAYDIDRESVAKELGFAAVSRNSMDSVSDRDFIIEYEAAASICMMHISRLAEELVIWSTEEFGFIEIDDAFTTGSSIMPQKKNPDMAELARGKTGRVYGRLVAMLTTMKALPLSYNRDLQEDKEGLFDCVDTLLSSLEVFTGMVGSMKINAEKTALAAGQGYILATDLADYLVKKGAAFRDAHGIIARLVHDAVEQGKSLSELNLDEFKKYSSLFGDDVLGITVESSLASRDATGGTSPERVNEELARAKKMLM